MGSRSADQYCSWFPHPIHPKITLGAMILDMEEGSTSKHFKAQTGLQCQSSSHVYLHHLLGVPYYTMNQPKKVVDSQRLCTMIYNDIQ